ncbi:MAG TPA: citrate synthase/methylcitrate synthase [Blastocatellia bacterium]|jgi:citrate synthase|nr:citrate synthase/methylcitrate synthase [Blastocatellia bacterium]
MVNETPEGLEGVVAASTRLSLVDGANGRLILSGYSMEEIAPRASFEEVTHLLWSGRLPNRQELKDLSARLASRRRLPPGTCALLRDAAGNAVPVMDALRMAASTLSIGRSESPEEDALAVVAAFPAIVGGYWRLRNGQEPLEPREDLSHAEHYLHQIFGGEIGTERARGLETYLNTVCDHGFNASTFTARVIVSTRSDIVSAVTGAVGALKGPLHGGAPGPALDMVFEIGEADRAEAVILARLERGDRLMGFGHRVYRVRDPRADVLAAAAERFYTTEGNRELYELAIAIERTALRLLAQHKPDRRINTNVEFYTALLLHGLGLPSELFTPTFAISRVLGWTAHCLEQLREGRLIRPESKYIGPTDLHFQDLDTRAND